MGAYASLPHIKNISAYFITPRILNLPLMKKILCLVEDLPLLAVTQLQASADEDI